MKLQIVPASQGFQWVKLGFRTFFKQPLALSGLFFLFLASMSVLSLVPVLGNALALALLPAATLGLMVASEEAAKGNFPMPSVLLSAFKAGKQQLRSMLILGAAYAVSFLLVLALTALADGGKFAKLYLVGGTITPELLQEPDFEVAALIAAALYLPLSLLFWHAPALVHWHGVTPVKSMFFSLVACLRNFWAFTIFGLAWMGAFIGTGIAVAIFGMMLGNPGLITLVMFPIALLLAAIFFTSIYFTFRDSFDSTTGDTP
jgi:hypothetical protein